MITLRGYQERCIGGVRESFRRGNTSVLLVSPTGSGKTVMFAYIAQQAAGKGSRVMIMAHRKELLSQCGNKLMQNGLDFSYVRPKFTADYNQPVQVGTIQTIAGRMDNMLYWCSTLLKNILWAPDLIVIDEAHRSLAPTYLKIVRFWSNARILGVTATPARGDKKPLRILYNDMVLGPGYPELIAEGHLKRPLTYGPKVEIDLSLVSECDNEVGYNVKELEAAVDQAAVTGSAVEAYCKICPGVTAIAFCVSVKHSLRVAEEFRRAGYRFEHIDGEMSDKERESILDRLASGELDGATNVDLFTEGLDVPRVQCAILLRPTRNAGLYLQMAGRALRPYPGQDFAFILDHAGLAKRHGGIDEDREWSLDGLIKKKKRKGETQGRSDMMQCPECYIVHRVDREAKAKQRCPECGYVYDFSRDVVQLDGELELMDKSRQHIDGVNDGVLAHLVTYGKKKGYADSWAMNVYTELNQR